MIRSASISTFTKKWEVLSPATWVIGKTDRGTTTFSTTVMPSDTSPKPKLADRGYNPYAKNSSTISQPRSLLLPEQTLHH
jgi:hypothetical protein